MEHAPEWLINSFIYLAAAVIAVPVAKKLGLGAIIGCLAAGIAIGPWGILVVAVDGIEQSISILDLAKEQFPRLEIVARARDVTHWNQLRDRGVTRVEPELFESSLRSARSVLELLGHPPHEARQSARRFRQHNLALFEQIYPHHKDRSKVIAVAKQGRLQLEEQMPQEREQLSQKRPACWHEEHATQTAIIK